jgi:hypothetical protein
MDPTLTSQEFYILEYICANVVQYRTSRTIVATFAADVQTLRNKLSLKDSLSNREWWMLLYFSANAKSWNMPKGAFYWTEVKSLEKKLMSRGSAYTRIPAS